MLSSSVEQLLSRTAAVRAGALSMTVVVRGAAHATAAGAGEVRVKDDRGASEEPRIWAARGYHEQVNLVDGVWSRAFGMTRLEG